MDQLSGDIIETGLRSQILDIVKSLAIQPRLDQVLEQR